MRNDLHALLLLLALTAVPAGLSAQSEGQDDGTQHKKLTLSGSIQSDNLIPTGKQDDNSNEDFRSNTYVDLNANSQYVDAGLRFEYLEHPLPGFENDFKGWGVPYFYVKGKLKNVEPHAGYVLRAVRLGLHPPHLRGTILGHRQLAVGRSSGRETVQGRPDQGAQR